MSNEKKNIKTKSQSSQSSQSSKKSQGMGPSLRMASTDIRQLTREAENTSTSRLTPEGGSPPGESIFDCIAFVIVCPAHNKVAISKVERAKAVWLPFVACPPNKTWKDASEDGVSIIFSKGDSELDAKLGTKIPVIEMRCLHVFRFQEPTKLKFISRLIQFVKLGKNTTAFKCCQNTKRIQWLPMSDVLAGNVEKVWGPEVTQFAKIAKEIKPQGIDEYGLEQAFFYVPKDPPRSIEESMLKTLNMTEVGVEKLYSDFIEHCFPAFAMTLDSFKDYMTKNGHKKDDPRFPLLFSAFNYNRNAFLTFHELLLGLTSMEPNTSNTEARLKFVFRYYDSDGDGFLTEEEFKKLCKDISPSDNENSIQTKASEGMKVIGVKDNKICLTDFCKAVGSKTFRGTSSLCRSPKEILSQISKTMAARTETRKASAKKSAGFLKENRKNRGICPGCRGKKYDYGLHSVRLDTNGRCVEPRRIFEPETMDEEMNRQRYSMEYVFNTRSIPHVFLDLIREFCHKKKTAIDSVGSNDKQTFGKYLQSLCTDSQNVFLAEERVIRINSPVCVVGDIDGNIDDLQAMEKCLWQSLPIISANYVFLGNFIGKANFSIECAVYLFALKMIAPNKFFILRGDLEVRPQTQTLQKECLTKYGDQLGTKIYELLNIVFDFLPLSVIIDESIFCSHGGIPNSTKRLADIRHIAADLKNPKDSNIAWEVLTNKPLDSQQSNGGYNESALKDFLATNGFSHVIQGNQQSNSGFGIHFENKCLTLCGNGSETAAAFVDSDRIRILRLETNSSKVVTTKAVTTNVVTTNVVTTNVVTTPTTPTTPAKHETNTEKV